MCSCRVTRRSSTRTSSVLRLGRAARQPALLGRPVIVGVGVVLAASDEAGRGVRSRWAVTGPCACARTRSSSAADDPYTEASRAMFAISTTRRRRSRRCRSTRRSSTRRIERIGGMPGQIARRLRSEVRQQVGLPISVGVARTKYLAKIASARPSPTGCWSSRRTRAGVLHPLPVEAMWGVGPATAARIQRVGIETVGRSRRSASRRWSRSRRGRGAQAVRARPEPRPAAGHLGPRRRSLGTQRALGRRPAHVGGARLDARRARRPPVAAATADRAGRRTAPCGCATSTRRARRARARSRRRPRGRAAPRHAPWPAGRRAAVDRRRGLTLLGITLTNLDEAGGVQLELPLERRRASALDAALDAVRERYGADAVRRAALLGRDTGLEVPLLPD